MTKEQKKSTSGEVLVENQEDKSIVAQDNQIVKPEADIDAYIELRQEFIKKVNAICVEGKDYHVIQGKKSLAKGGAEKIASIFKWTAKFEKDTESLEMLGQIVGLVAFKCTLMNGHFVGEGRGATTLAKNAGDVNKTLKMAQKSAFIDAVLRASGLSDFFTQDLEDMPAQNISKPQYTNNGNIVEKPAYDNSKPSSKQLKFIEDLARAKGYTMFNVMELQKKVLRSPSDLITYLKGCPPKMKEELPVIQLTEITPEEKAIADSIPF